MIQSFIQSATVMLALACAERDARTAENDSLGGENAALAEERDKLAWRLGEVEADRHRVAAELDARTAERDWFGGEHAALAEQRDKAHWRLGEVEAELASAHGGIDDLKHRLAVTESTLRQREEEIAQIGRELEGSRGEVARQASAAAEAEDRASRAEAEKDSQDRRSAERLAEVVELSKLLHERDREVEALTSEASAHQDRLAKRFAEIAQLSRLYSEREEQLGEERDRVEWLRRVHSVIERCPRWWAFMPVKWRRRHELGRLQRKGLFDAEAYVSQYPDVVAEGADPLRHYILHGMKENRKLQLVNNR